jgi:hypothetical protein
MLAVVETPEFAIWAEKVWTVAEREAFVDWIALNRKAGTSYLAKLKERLDARED